MKSKIFIAISLCLSSNAFSASLFLAGNITGGNFINPIPVSPGSEVISGVGTTQINWGTAIAPSTDSFLRFTLNNLFSDPINQSVNFIQNGNPYANDASGNLPSFDMVTLTFHNGTTDSITNINEASTSFVVNSVHDQTGQDPGHFGNPQNPISGETLEYFLKITNTLNDPNGVHSDADADYVSLWFRTPGSSTLTQLCEKRTDENGNPIQNCKDQLRVWEGETTSATIKVHLGSFYLLGFDQIVALQGDTEQNHGFLTSSVPEPSALALVAIGLMGMFVKIGRSKEIAN